MIGLVVGLVVGMAVAAGLKASAWRAENIIQLFSENETSVMNAVAHTGRYSQTSVN